MATIFVHPKNQKATFEKINITITSVTGIMLVASVSMITLLSIYLRIKAYAPVSKACKKDLGKYSLRKQSTLIHNIIGFLSEV